jgi:hypothetical protein
MRACCRHDTRAASAGAIFIFAAAADTLAFTMSRRHADIAFADDGFSFLFFRSLMPLYASFRCHAEAAPPVFAASAFRCRQMLYAAAIASASAERHITPCLIYAAAYAMLAPPCRF